MNLIMKWFRNRVALGAFAVAALAVALWFVGDVLVLFGRRPLESDTSRGLVAVILVLGWVAFELRHRLTDARAQREGANRPYLVVRNALAVRGTNWLGVTLENIGTGPALDITAEGRLIEEGLL